MLKLFEHNTLSVNDIGEEQTAVEVKTSTCGLATSMC